MEGFPNHLIIWWNLYHNLRQKDVEPTNLIFGFLHLFAVDCGIKSTKKWLGKSLDWNAHMSIILKTCTNLIWEEIEEEESDIWHIQNIMAVINAKDILNSIHFLFGLL